MKIEERAQHAVGRLRLVLAKGALEERDDVGR